MAQKDFYLNIWERWEGLMQLTREDQKEVFDHLHKEVQAGISILAGVALEEMKLVLKDVGYSKKDAFLDSAETILVFSLFSGYSFFLLTQKINPLKNDLSGRKSVENLGHRWMEQFEKDQNQKYLAKIDPIYGLMLTRMYELRVNQLLAMHPEIVDYAYQIVEGLNQYVGWAVRQGYILGMIEQELAGLN